MSNTPNLDLERPDKGDTEWHTSLNSNMAKLDDGYGNNVATVADLPKMYIETGTFNHDTGDTITLPVAVDAINEYSVEITATTGAGTDPELIWVEKGTTNFVVKCNGNNTTDTFDAVIYYLGDINSYGGSIYRKWYVSTDAAITDHGDTADTGSFAWVLDQIGAAPATVELPGNKSYTITTATAVPSNVNIISQKGGVFGGVGTLTFDNPLQIDASPNQQIFGSSITVVFTNGGTVYPEWAGVDGTADDVQMNAAIGWITKGIVSLQANKTYNNIATVTIDKDRVSLIGGGQQSTIINFDPVAGDVCVEIDKGGTQCVQNRIKGMAFSGASDTTNQKVAVRVEDAGEFILEDIAVSNWTGDTSIGLQLQGRQTHTYKNLTINCDLPVSIEDNPNVTIDSDHYHFQDCYFTAKADNSFPVVLVADGVNITNLTFDGYQAWVYGSYAFYWSDTATSAVSSSIAFKNIRWEQSTSGNHAFYISHNYALQNLSFENVYFGATTNVKGFYLRKTKYVSFKDVVYAGTIEGFNADVTCDVISFMNTFFQTGGTASTTGLTQVWADPTTATGSPISNNAFYVTTSAAITTNSFSWGIRTWKGTGTIANSAYVTLPLTDAQDAIAHIRLVGYHATGPIQEGGIAFQTPSSIVLLSGSANFAVTSVASKLCLIFTAGAATRILNNTAQTLTYLIEIEWVY